MIGLVRENTHSYHACEHGRIKAWETATTDFLGFFYVMKYNIGVEIMNSSWSKVFIAAVFEVLWVIGLKHADDLWTWFGTILCILISFYLMISSSKKLPVGTVYAVFVGLGTVGTVFAEIAFFGELFKVEKLILILLLLVGVIGLKIESKDRVKEGANT